MSDDSASERPNTAPADPADLLGRWLAHLEDEAAGHGQPSGGERPSPDGARSMAQRLRAARAHVDGAAPTGDALFEMEPAAPASSAHEPQRPQAPAVSASQLGIDGQALMADLLRQVSPETAPIAQLHHHEQANTEQPAPGSEALPHVPGQPHGEHEIIAATDPLEGHRTTEADGADEAGRADEADGAMAEDAVEYAASAAVDRSRARSRWSRLLATEPAPSVSPREQMLTGGSEGAEDACAASSDTPVRPDLPSPPDPVPSSDDLPISSWVAVSPPQPPADPVDALRRIWGEADERAAAAEGSRRRRRRGRRPDPAADDAPTESEETTAPDHAPSGDDPVADELADQLDDQLDDQLAAEQAEVERAARQLRELAEAEDSYDLASLEDTDLLVAERAAAEQTAHVASAERAQAERAADDTAAPAAERESADHEAAEREAAEQAAREAAERQATERAAADRAALEAAQQAARRAADQLAAERAAREDAEQAARRATEQAAAERTAREAAELAAQQMAEQAAADARRDRDDAADLAARRVSERRSARETPGSPAPAPAAAPVGSTPPTTSPATGSPTTDTPTAPPPARTGQHDIAASVVAATTPDPRATRKEARRARRTAPDKSARTEPAGPAARPAGAPQAAPDIPSVVNFPVRRNLRRATGVLELGVLAGVVWAAYAVYQAPTTTTMVVAVILGALLIVVHAVRSSASPAQVSIDRGTLDVVHHHSHHRFDLTNEHIAMETHGEPRDRGWRFEVHRRSMAPFRIDRSMVDPEEFMRVVRRYRPGI